MVHGVLVAPGMLGALVLGLLAHQTDSSHAVPLI